MPSTGGLLVCHMRKGIVWAKWQTLSKTSFCPAHRNRVSLNKFRLIYAEKITISSMLAKLEGF